MLVKIRQLKNKIMQNKVKKEVTDFTIEVVITHKDKYGFKITHQQTTEVGVECEESETLIEATRMESLITDAIWKNYDAVKSL